MILLLYHSQKVSLQGVIDSFSDIYVTAVLLYTAPYFHCRWQIECYSPSWPISLAIPCFSPLTLSRSILSKRLAYLDLSALPPTPDNPK